LSATEALGAADVVFFFHRLRLISLRNVTLYPIFLACIQCIERCAEVGDGGGGVLAGYILVDGFELEAAYFEEGFGDEAGLAEDGGIGFGAFAEANDLIIVFHKPFVSYFKQGYGIDCSFTVNVDVFWIDDVAHCF
jgi:hypothetical protein